MCIRDRSRAEEKQITLENNIYNPIIVEGDEKLLRQVALNLVDNGVKYTQEGGRVWIEAEEGLDHVEFIEMCIRDRIRGGGENSIIIADNSKVKKIIVSRLDGPVRVKVEDDSSVDLLIVDDGKDKVTLEGTMKNIVVKTSRCV